MKPKDKKPQHNFSRPSHDSLPPKEDYEEARRLFKIDGPIENPNEIFPHKFSASERDSILGLVPSNTTDDAKNEFLLHLGFAIGSYQYWRQSPPKRADFKRLYRELKKIRNYSSKMSAAITKLPIQFRERLDVGVGLSLLSKRNFADELDQPTRVWSADWSNSFTSELAILISVADDVEQHLKDKNTGGSPQDDQMTLLARKTLVAYASCFKELPPVTESHPFTKILKIVTRITGRHGAEFFSVMHYVDKVISEVRPNSKQEVDQSQHKA